MIYANFCKKRKKQLGCVLKWLQYYIGGREYAEDHRGFVFLVAVARMPPLLLLNCRLKVVFAKMPLPCNVSKCVPVQCTCLRCIQDCEAGMRAPPRKNWQNLRAGAGQSWIHSIPHYKKGIQVFLLNICLTQKSLELDVFWSSFVPLFADHPH